MIDDMFAGKRGRGQATEIVKHSAEKQPETSRKRPFAYSMRILRIFYGYSMIPLSSPTPRTFRL